MGTPEIRIIPPQRPEAEKTKRDFVGGEVPPEPPEFGVNYFPDNLELAKQKFYEVPMRKLPNYDEAKAPWAMEIIRDAAGQISGLPKLRKGESWCTFTGPDGKLYVTKNTQATSEEIGKFEELAPIE